MFSTSIKDCNAVDSHGHSILMLAIAERNQDLFTYLIAREKIDLNYETKNGHTALSLAFRILCDDVNSIPGVAENRARAWQMKTYMHDLLDAGAIPSQAFINKVMDSRRYSLLTAPEIVTHLLPIMRKMFQVYSDDLEDELAYLTNKKNKPGLSSSQSLEPPVSSIKQSGRLFSANSHVKPVEADTKQSSVRATIEKLSPRLIPPLSPPSASLSPRQLSPRPASVSTPLKPLAPPQAAASSTAKPFVTPQVSPHLPIKPLVPPLSKHSPVPTSSSSNLHEFSAPSLSETPSIETSSASSCSKKITTSVSTSSKATSQLISPKKPDPDAGRVRFQTSPR